MVTLLKFIRLYLSCVCKVGSTTAHVIQNKQCTLKQQSKQNELTELREKKEELEKELEEWRLKAEETPDTFEEYVTSKEEELKALDEQVRVIYSALIQIYKRKHVRGPTEEAKHFCEYNTVVLCTLNFIDFIIKSLHYSPAPITRRRRQQQVYKHWHCCQMEKCRTTSSRKMWETADCIDFDVNNLIIYSILPNCYHVRAK